MKLNLECQYLVDRYVDEVGYNLPRKGRADIAVEIRSLILDALEDRSQQADLQPDEPMVLEVLKDLGAPLEMAANYRPVNYLIGPKLYASFLLTAKIVLAVIGFSFLFGMLFARSYSDPLAALGDGILELSGAFFRTVGILVVIYAILDRVMPEQDWETQLKVWGRFSRSSFFRGLLGRQGQWDPTELKTESKADRVNRVGMIWEIVLVVLLMVLFNIFPHKVGVFGFRGDQAWFLPLLSGEFSRYLLGWNVYWLLSLVYNFGLLALGRRTRALRWTEIGLMVLSGGLVFWMITGPSILGLNPAYLALNPVDPDVIAFAREPLLGILQVVLQLSLVVHLIVKAVRVVFRSFRLLNKAGLPVWSLKSR